MLSTLLIVAGVLVLMWLVACLTDTEGYRERGRKVDRERRAWKKSRNEEIERLVEQLRRLRL